MGTSQVLSPATLIPPSRKKCTPMSLMGRCLCFILQQEKQRLQQSNQCAKLVILAYALGRLSRRLRKVK